MRLDSQRASVVVRDDERGCIADGAEALPATICGPANVIRICRESFRGPLQVIGGLHL
jgi:hypothetical protein